MITLFPLSILIFIGLIVGLNRLLRSRVSKKISLRLLGIYMVLLLLSPLVAGFALEGPRESQVVTPPNFYYQRVLDDYENRSLDELKEDDYLHLLEETEIPVDLNDFSENQPLRISSRHQGYEYGNHLVIEVTDEVDSVEITQFIQRAYIDHVEISGDFIPWNWTVTGGRLQAEIPRTEVELYMLSPSPHHFHFQEEIGSPLSPIHMNFPKVGMLQWIRVPEGLNFQLSGVVPERVIEQ